MKMSLTYPKTVWGHLNFLTHRVQRREVRGSNGILQCDRMAHLRRGRGWEKGAEKRSGQRRIKQNCTHV